MALRRAKVQQAAEQHTEAATVEAGMPEISTPEEFSQAAAELPPMSRAEIMAVPAELAAAQVHDAPPVEKPSSQAVVSELVADIARGTELPPANGTVNSGATQGPGRAWTQRYFQPVAYRRFEAKDPLGTSKIHFAFHLKPGQTVPEEEVLAVVRDHKFFKNGKPNGLAEDAQVDQDSHHTGLAFKTSPKWGKTWELPNTEFGRTVADSLDQALDGVAKRLEREGPTPF